MKTGQLDTALEQSTHNLLKNCVGFAEGQSVLIVGENHDTSFFDPAVCDLVHDAVISLGGKSQVVMAPATTGPEDFPTSIAEQMQGADHTIFFSRLGDQVRFCPLPGTGTKTMCYVHEESYLRDEFGSVNHGLYKDVNKQLLSELSTKKTCHITCPQGSDLTGELQPISQDGGGNLTEEFSVELFPIMIIPPLSGTGLSGKLALGRWLMTTSTRSYEDSLFELNSPLIAIVEEGTIVHFEGDKDEARRAEQHFKRVGALSGGDPFALNSWHAGTNPKTFYNGRAEDNLEKWSDLVYGSPRYTHFHACGKDPGDIAISLIDATIKFDGESYWDNGKFAYLDKPHVTEIRNQYPGCENAYEMRWDIGI